MAYSNDPRTMRSRFLSRCSICGNTIQKGEQIIYWPIGKKAMHYKCGEIDYLKAQSAISQEDCGCSF